MSDAALTGRYTSMTRVRILLTKKQDRRLEKLARRLRTSKASLIREGVELLLKEKGAAHDDTILELIGQAGAAGIRDLSSNHDEYLAAIGRRRHR